MNFKQTKLSCARNYMMRGVVVLLLGAGLTGVSFSSAAQTGVASPPLSAPTTEPEHMPMDMHGSMINQGSQTGSMGSSGDIDHDFATMMKEHHQGAIDMAEKQLKEGKDPQLKQMARDIISSQKKEIEQFDEWLEAHKPPKK